VTIPFEKGLLGHSDGDVIIHAICDALLGALALGDIGRLFPDTDERTKDMYSLKMLEAIIQDIISPEYAIVNIDVNCIAEKPKLTPYREDMVSRIANACRAEKERVSIKFRTNEGLDEIGRGNAIAAQAVILLRKKS
jgi:2-C-methyl-D-erythritol 2,4-cyclodiphosphate synthase